MMRALVLAFIRPQTLSARTARTRRAVALARWIVDVERHRQDTVVHAAQAIGRDWEALRDTPPFRHVAKGWGTLVFFGGLAALLLYQSLVAGTTFLFGAGVGQVLGGALVVALMGSLWRWAPAWATCWQAYRAVGAAWDEMARQWRRGDPMPEAPDLPAVWDGGAPEPGSLREAPVPSRGD